MYICIVGNGESIFIKNWIFFFLNRGHEVSLITDRNPHINGLNVYKIHRKDMGITNNIKNIFIVKKYLKKINPDVIHVHYTLGYGGYVALSGKPYILSVWGSDVFGNYNKYPLRGFQVWFALKKAKVIVYTAPNMREILENKYCIPPERLIRNRWGIDINIFKKNYESDVEILRKKLNIAPDSVIITSVRGLKPIYNPKNIVDAVKYINKMQKNVVLIMLRGNAKLKEVENIKKQVQSEKLKNVIFVDKYLSPREMAVLFNMSHAFISIPDYDQFGSSVKEGMACGSIPIVSNLGVYKQYLTPMKNALFVNPKDPKDIAEKVIYAVEHPEIREEYYKVNWEIIKKYEDWEKNALEMERLYKKFMEGRL